MAYFEPDRGEMKLSPRFVTDLADALGGRDVNHEYQSGAFTVGDLRVILRQGWGAKARRVRVVCTAADTEACRRAYSQGGSFPFPEATIDPERPLDAVVKDLQRRIIDKAAPALARVAEASAKQSAEALQLREHAERINDRFPGTVTEHTDSSKREAGFYFNQAGSYLSGRLCSDGRLYVDRLGTVPAHKVERLLALLAEA